MDFEHARVKGRLIHRLMEHEESRSGREQDDVKQNEKSVGRALAGVVAPLGLS